VIFERVLQTKCKVWGIQFNYFVFKPDSPSDLNSDCYHILNLNKKTVYLVKDWVGDPSY